MSTLPIEVLTKIDWESEAPRPAIVPSYPKPKHKNKNEIDIAVKNAATGIKIFEVSRRSSSKNFEK